MREYTLQKQQQKIMESAFALEASKDAEEKEAKEKIDMLHK